MNITLGQILCALNRHRWNPRFHPNGHKLCRRPGCPAERCWCNSTAPVTLWPADVLE